MPDFYTEPNDTIQIIFRGKLELSQFRSLITDVETCLEASAVLLMGPNFEGRIFDEETRRASALGARDERLFRTEVEIGAGSIIVTIAIFVLKHPAVSAKLAKLGAKAVIFVGKTIAGAALAAGTTFAVTRSLEMLFPKIPDVTVPEEPKAAATILAEAAKNIAATVANSPNAIEAEFRGNINSGEIGFTIRKNPS